MVVFFKTPLCLVIQGNVDGLYSIDKVYNVELLTPLFFLKIDLQFPKKFSLHTKPWNYHK